MLIISDYAKWEPRSEIGAFSGIEARRPFVTVFDHLGDGCAEQDL
jgi:hypothetical protein